MDGSLLADYLLPKGYEIHGIVRRTSSFNTGRIEHLYKDYKGKSLFLHYGDLTDGSNISRIIEKVRPDYIFNYGAQSHVKISFDVPEYSAQVDGIGVIRLLDAAREICPNTKILQASTSELFGKVAEIPQRETTPFRPRSPYAAAKLYAYWVCKNYREAYNMYICNSICFNHEGPRRSENFVTRKITLSVAKIKYGLQDKIELGNLSAKRDWGYSEEYVVAMWKMLQQDKPDDYVIATGEMHSVEEFCEEAFKEIDMPLTFKGNGANRKGYDKNGKIRVEVNPKYFRPTEVEELCGDASKAKSILNWEPKVKFKDLVKIMVKHDVKLLG